MSRVFAVAGVTGHVGGAVAEELLAAGHKVRGIVRSVESEASKKLATKGVELFEATFGDVIGLTKAFTGAEGAFILTPPEAGSVDPLGDTERYGEAFKKAIIAAKTVRRVAILSSFGAHLSSGTGVIYKCHILEELFRDLPQSESQAAVIFVRAGYFAENILGSVYGAQQYGVLAPLVEGHISLPFTTTHDIGLHTAALLADQSIQKEVKIVDVIGPSWATYADVNSALCEALGKPIQLVPVPRAERQAKLESYGLAAPSAKLLTELTIGLDDGTIAQEPGHQQLFGSQTLKQFITKVTTKA
jgi:uncharacterized protein YbjT (DUF2867 family)